MEFHGFFFIEFNEFIGILLIFYGISLNFGQVVRYLQGGEILQPPQFASCAIYALMRSCWRPCPTDRPHFADLYDELCNIEAALGEQDQLKDDPVRL